VTGVASQALRKRCFCEIDMPQDAAEALRVPPLVADGKVPIFVRAAARRFAREKQSGCAPMQSPERRASLDRWVRRRPSLERGECARPGDGV
jgi:hypothetical protein